MGPLELIVVAAGLATNIGLLWKIASKVGCLDGKMSFVVDKIEEHNALAERVLTLEVRERIRRGQEPDLGRPVDEGR